MQFKNAAGVILQRHVKLEALVMALDCQREMIPFSVDAKPHVLALPSSMATNPVISREGPIPSLSYQIFSYLIPDLNHAVFDIGLRTYSRAAAKVELIDYMRLEQDLHGRMELAEFRGDHWHYEVLNLTVEKPVREAPPRKEWLKTEKTAVFNSFVKGNFRSEREFLLWLRYQCPLEMTAQSVFEISETDMDVIVSHYLDGELAKLV